MFERFEVLQNADMRQYTTLKLGGTADWLAFPRSAAEIAELFAEAGAAGLPVTVIGHGSNVLVLDGGIRGLVIRIDKNMKNIRREGNRLTAAAGAMLGAVAGFAAENGLTGLEFASGIPGTVGGAVTMNAGAYGGEMKDAVESVVCLYTPDQGLYELTAEQCAFAYRKSYFSTHPGCVILSAVFRLQPGDKDEIAAKMREMNEKRRAKQPLELPSAGSAFKRPEGHYAGALIEQAGLKGYTVGGAQVSEKHAGFVVNRGGATSHDVYDLMMHVRNTVYRESGVQLEPEIIILPPDYKLEDHSPKALRNRITINAPAEE